MYSTFIGPSNDPHHLCLVVYRMRAGFIPTLSSHGNSKIAQPFLPTWPSTLNRIKEECISKGPKAVVEQVSSEVGGIICASEPGQLPRNELQVSNQKRKGKSSGAVTFVGKNAAADDLFVIMQQAHTQDPSHKFVRDIKTAPEPAIVLASEQQHNDLVRFCTCSEEFSIVTIDPTFSLGEFDVTPMTYRHLLLTTRRNKQLQPPIFLGPTLIHYRKTFPTYLFFASSLIGQCPQLERIRAFGTDGEQALIKAFSHEFGFSQHLTCFIHVRRNIKDKLNECHVPSHVAKEVLDNIFGKRVGGVFEEGLVDSTDNSDFQAKVESLVAKWSNMQDASAMDMRKFIEWFKANKVQTICSTMLRSVREECGLGNPPDIFTTNPSESINAMLKHKMDYKKNELPTFVEKVRELSLEQNKEVERAIVNRGKYKFRAEYQFLEIPESKWFTMSIQQRKTHISKVHSLHLASAMSEITYEPSSSDKPCASQKLSLTAESAAKGMNIPLVSVEGIICPPQLPFSILWRKATELISDANAIGPAPGQNEQARMVKSFNGKAPHLVTPTKAGGYTCDANCPNWKSIAFCSHTVAVAQINGKLPQFISSTKKKKKTPNITQLVTSDMPRGHGRKGAIPPRKRKLTEVPGARVPMTIADSDSGIVTPSTSEIYHPPVSAPGYYSSPSYMYPSYPYQFPMFNSAPELSNPFKLCFIKGNISICIGCNNRYSKSPKPPDDLCIKHQEWRQFTPQGADVPQKKYSNVYYHCKPECVWLRCPYFFPGSLQTDEVDEQLLPQHKQHLSSCFGLSL